MFIKYNNKDTDTKLHSLVYIDGTSLTSRVRQLVDTSIRNQSHRVLNTKIILDTSLTHLMLAYFLTLYDVLSITPTFSSHIYYSIYKHVNKKSNNFRLFIENATIFLKYKNRLFFALYCTRYIIIACLIVPCLEHALRIANVRWASLLRPRPATSLE